MKKGIFVTAFCLASILIIVAGYNYFNHTDDTGLIASKAKITSHELLRKLASSDSLMLNSYIEKAIEIRGPVKEISKKDSKVTVILDAGKDREFVICEMQANQNIRMEQVQQGDIINIKGIYKGVLLDAILLNCILIDEKANG